MAKAIDQSEVILVRFKVSGEVMEMTRQEFADIKARQRGVEYVGKPASKPKKIAPLPYPEGNDG